MCYRNCAADNEETSGGSKSFEIESLERLTRKVKLTGRQRTRKVTHREKGTSRCAADRIVERLWAGTPAWGHRVRARASAVVVLFRGAGARGCAAGLAGAVGRRRDHRAHRERAHRRSDRGLET